MSYCPKCRYEYESGVGVCPECNTPLVDILPEQIETVEEPTDSVEWVPLARFQSVMSAQMLIEVLRNNRIPAVLRYGTDYYDIRGGGTSTFSRTTYGAYTLMVPVEYVEEVDLHGAGILGDDWEKMKLYDIE